MVIEAYVPLVRVYVNEAFVTDTPLEYGIAYSDEETPLAKARLSVTELPSPASVIVEGGAVCDTILVKFVVKL